jgi:glycosyltransferase involved in cell wall biosynthesis
MKIAQVAPLHESVPPKSYGGTERVVSYLTEELVNQGHDVTLFASGDSVTAADLIPACPRSLRLDESCRDRMAHLTLQLDLVFQRAREFDVIHFHTDYTHYPFSCRQKLHHLTTLHGRLDLPDLIPLYERFADIPVVSISNSQRAPFPDLHWQGTVYHGLPEDLYTFHSAPGKYLAFLGRVSPEKRVDRAIEIARRCGLTIKIAAKVDPVDEQYFCKTIKPLLNDPCCEFLGEIGQDEKDEFLGNAMALLFPIDWPEPFGLVLIESMACGTPVIAYANGSVPEIVSDGENGFLVDNLKDAVDAVEKLETVSRRRCREMFETRFSTRRMTSDYVSVYQSLLAREFRSKQISLARVS